MGLQSGIGAKILPTRAMTQRQKEQIEVERHQFTGLVLYEVTGEELDAIEHETSAISDDFSFASISLTVAVSFAITLATTKIDSNRTYLTFLTFVIIGGIATLFFGIRWLRGRGARGTIIKRIKARVGPLGQEGKEINPKELAELPGQEAATGEDR